MYSFERRLRAFSIDVSFAFILAIIWFFSSYQFSFPNQLKAGIAVGILLLVMVLPHFFRPGQTFGKRNQKMSVVFNNDSNIVPGLWLLILREVFKLGAILFTFGVYTLIAGIISTNRRDGRTIHDFIFRTKVICLTRTTSDTYLINATGAAKESLKGSGPFDN